VSIQNKKSVQLFCATVAVRVATFIMVNILRNAKIFCNLTYLIQQSFNKNEGA
jgi:hypothetical protein